MNDDTWKIIEMSILGAIGGIVRICSDGTITTWRMVIASLLVSTFSAAMTAMFLHELVSDPIYLGGLCGMGGYMGQLMLVLLEKKTRNVVSAMMK